MDGVYNLTNLDFITNLALNESDGHIGGIVGKSIVKGNTIRNVTQSGSFIIKTTASTSDLYAIGGIVGFAKS